MASIAAAVSATASACRNTGPTVLHSTGGAARESFGTTTPARRSSTDETVTGVVALRWAWTSGSVRGESRPMRVGAATDAVASLRALRALRPLARLERRSPFGIALAMLGVAADETRKAGLRLLVHALEPARAREAGACTPFYPRDLGSVGLRADHEDPLEVAHGTTVAPSPARSRAQVRAGTSHGRLAPCRSPEGSTAAAPSRTPPTSRPSTTTS